MDPGVSGALIGIGIMVCVGLTIVINDKGGKCLERYKQKYVMYKLQKQPLLPVTSQNPLLVRISSKQFKMKDLVTK
jgi:hypothetical protein